MNKDTNSSSAQSHKAPGYYLFAALFMALCLLPLAGLLWAGSAPSSDEASLSALPEPVDENGSVNLSYFQDLGTYFEDHFAYRNLAVDLNARVQACLLQTSPTEQVIVGVDGWLFYGGTLEDYLATNPLSSREIHNITHNLALMQGYTEAMGAEFVFTIAPNKNTLYPHYMPYYYPGTPNDSMDRLAQSLEEEGIHYVDLFDLFSTTDEVLYYKTDTHWTTEGALLAANALLDAVERNELSVSSEQADVIAGDIERMLYPVTAEPEESLFIDTGTWAFTETNASVEDDSVTTASPEGEGTLLMYRDSFANTLIPYLAPEFSEAEFTKLIPYNLSQIAEFKPAVVIIERAERHVRLLNEDPPFMYAPTVELEINATSQTESWAEWYVDGDFRIIEGYVDEAAIGAEDTIFVSVETPDGEETIYVPFQISRLTHRDDLSEEAAMDPSTTPQNNGVASSQDVESDNEGSSTVNGATTEYGFRLFLDDHTLTDGEYTIRVIVSKPQVDTTSAVATVVLSK